MTVEKLLALLNDLPVEALQKPIFMEGGDINGDITLVSVVYDATDIEEIAAYILVADRNEESVQFDFTKDMN